MEPDFLGPRRRALLGGVKPELGRRLPWAGSGGRIQPRPEHPRGEAALGSSFSSDDGRGSLREKALLSEMGPGPPRTLGCSGSASHHGCVLTWGGSSGQRARSQARGAQTAGARTSQDEHLGGPGQGRVGRSCRAGARARPRDLGTRCHPRCGRQGQQNDDPLLGNRYIYKAGWRQPGPSLQAAWA